MISEEIHPLEEVTRIATAVGQRKQGTWTKQECKKTELSQGVILSTWNLKNQVSLEKQSTTFYKHQSTFMLGG